MHEMKNHVSCVMHALVKLNYTVNMRQNGFSDKINLCKSISITFLSGGTGVIYVIERKVHTYVGNDMIRFSYNPHDYMLCCLNSGTILYRKHEIYKCLPTF